MNFGDDASRPDQSHAHSVAFGTRIRGTESFLPVLNFRRVKLQIRDLAWNRLHGRSENIGQARELSLKITVRCRTVRLFSQHSLYTLKSSEQLFESRSALQK